MRRIVAVALLLAVLALPFAAVRGSAGQPLTLPTPVNRVALLVLENRSYEQVIGNRSAPYLNHLARSGALATHYFALTHPSLPNYMALTTGGHKDVNHDCAACRSTSQSLASQLETAGVSWRAYFEDMRNPLATRLVPGTPYNPHYNPFAYTSALRTPDPLGDVTGFASLHHDLANRTLPRFSWIAPNVWHDGHNGGLGAVDRFAKQLVPKILHALGPRGVLFITWDEGADSDTRGAHGQGGGRVPLIAVGPAARPHARVPVVSNHYALLKTIEAALHVRPLGHARDAQTPIMTGLLRP
jgi:phosphatidylinositol-3-phosphatase